jgi:hypothetical protein
MSKRMLYMSVVAVLAASGAAVSDPSLAMPLAGALAAKDLAVKDLAGTGATPVWYYREWGYGPVYAVEDEEEAPRYYRPRRYYYYDAYDVPSYGYAPRYQREDYAPRYYRRAPVGPDMTDYCATRYRSWDAESGTYLGYDGLRHPCP